jgi:membrane associated rhomboid family serine protease
MVSGLIIVWQVCQRSKNVSLTGASLAIGNIIGPQFFLQQQAPHYVLGIGAMLTAFAVMAASGLAYYVYCFYENKRRDRIHGDSKTATDGEVDLEALDHTDRENQKFRYIY